MAQNKSELPEGTDKIIAGASASEGDEQLIVTNSGVTDTRVTSAAETASDSGSSARDRVIGTVRSGADKLSGQAADKARDFVSQGLERSAEALAGVSKLVGDTASGIDERLGAEYGDYARRAAGAIENAASSLAAKNPDELIDDTRDFVRKSPGVALAGAAVVGFALARLVKNGLDSSSSRSSNQGSRRKGGRSTGSKD